MVTICAFRVRCDSKGGKGVERAHCKPKLPSSAAAATAELSAPTLTTTQADEQALKADLRRVKKTRWYRFARKVPINHPWMVVILITGGFLWEVASLSR